jgi:uncharacterized protein YbjQ (UPF0145 family)
MQTLARLQTLGDGGSLFTSGLSVNEFALLGTLQARPLAQVMGGSVVRVGPQLLPALPRRQIRRVDGRKEYKEPSRWQQQRYGWQEPVVCELSALTDAWRLARWRAFRRLRDEALAVNADLVVGVRLDRAALDLPEGTIDLVVTGTAVRGPMSRGDGPPVFTDLSAQDFLRVRSCGFEPTGLVTATSVVFVSPARSVRWARAQTPRQNWELEELNRGYQLAYDRVRGKLRDAVASAGGDGVVGVDLSHEVHEGDFEHRASLPQHKSTGWYRGIMGLPSYFSGAGESARKGRVITIHAAGTAVRRSDTPDIAAAECVMGMGTA